MFGLTQEQQDHYGQEGVFGPMRAVGERTAREVLADMSIVNDDVSPIFDVRTNRDRHLFLESVFDLGTCNSIVSAVRSILGNDIVLFRSDFFNKIPTVENAGNFYGGGSAQGVYDTKFEYLHWHQGTNFPGVAGIPSIGRAISKEEKYRDYYENMVTAITVWVALTPSSSENGAVQYWKGSHKMGSFRFRKCDQGRGLGGGDLELDVDPPEEECVTYSVKPGECLIFNNKVVHRSACNNTPTSRIGVGFRYVRSDVDIYPDMETDPYGLKLSKWGVVPVSGRVLNSKLPIAELEFLSVGERS